MDQRHAERRRLAKAIFLETCELPEAERARVLRAAGWSETAGGGWIAPGVAGGCARSYADLAGAWLAFGREAERESGASGAEGAGPLFEGPGLFD